MTKNCHPTQLGCIKHTCKRKKRKIFISLTLRRERKEKKARNKEVRRIKIRRSFNIATIIHYNHRTAKEREEKKKLFVYRTRERIIFINKSQYMLLFFPQDISHSQNTGWMNSLVLDGWMEVGKKNFQ